MLINFAKYLLNWVNQIKNPKTKNFGFKMIYLKNADFGFKISYSDYIHFVEVNAHSFKDDQKEIVAHITTDGVGAPSPFPVIRNIGRLFGMYNMLNNVINKMKALTLNSIPIVGILYSVCLLRYNYNFCEDFRIKLALTL